MSYNQKGLNHKQSLENVKEALKALWYVYTPDTSRKNLCQMIKKVCKDFHVRKVACDDVLPFISDPDRIPTALDAQKLKDVQKAKYGNKHVEKAAATTEVMTVTAEDVETVPTGIQFDGEMMSSLYIAQETGKRHSDVMRDIRNLLEQGVAASSFALGSYTDKQNQERPCYNITKKGCLLLISGYDAVLREKIIDRWEALETGKAVPAAKMDVLDIMQLQLTALREDRDRILKLEARFDKQDEERKIAEEEMYKLPEPTVELKEKTTRDYINDAVRKYGILTGIEYNKIYRTVYTEFRNIYHVDVIALAHNRGYKQVLDVISEKKEWLEQVYAIIYNMLRKLKTA